MSVSKSQLDESLPPRYEVRPLEGAIDKFIVLDDKESKAKIELGEEDGNEYVHVKEFEDTSETIFLGQNRETETFFDYGWIEEIFSEEEVNFEAQAATKLETGYERAYNIKHKESQAETLIDAAESALDSLEEGGLEAEKYRLHSSDDSKTLGNARLTIDGISNLKFDFAQFADPEWATAAAYISSLVLLQDSNRKPNISTGYGYKPGHENRETADLDLVQKAQDITSDQYDFFN